MFARSILLWPATVAVLLAGPAMAEPRVPLAVAAKQADAVALVTVQRVDQAAEPGSGSGVNAYWRHRVVAQVVRVVAGKGLRAGESIAIDQHQWRLDLAEHLRCKGGNTCQWPEKPALESALSRAPVEGQTVLALLKRTADGWQLAVDRAFDAAGRAAEIAGRSTP